MEKLPGAAEFQWSRFFMNTSFWGLTRIRNAPKNLTYCPSVQLPEAGPGLAAPQLES